MATRPDVRLERAISPPVCGRGGRRPGWAKHDATDPRCALSLASKLSAFSNWHRNSGTVIPVIPGIRLFVTSALFILMLCNDMNGRTKDDYDHERQALDAAHVQNEAGRDAFIALAHTALFAASVSFVGDVAPITQAICKPVLIAGWIADVVGLLALTFSFGAARRAIDARRVALNDSEPPTDVWAERLNTIALWSFPVGLLCLFSFVTANVVHADVRQAKPAANTELREKGSNAAAASTQSQQRTATWDRSDPSTSCPGPSAAARARRA